MKKTELIQKLEEILDLLEPYDHPYDVQRPAKEGLRDLLNVIRVEDIE